VADGIRECEEKLDVDDFVDVVCLRGFRECEPD